MRRWPLVVLFAIPLLDVVLLVYVATVIGGVGTVALVVLTALIGLMLVRAEGRYTLGRIQEKFAAAEVPTDELLDGGLLIAAGAFLLTPGLVTDVLGLLLVLPPTRYPIRLALKRWVVAPAAERRTGGLLSGNVYTFEFPGESGTGYGSGAGFGGAPGFDREPTSGDEERADAAGMAGDEPYDLGSDAYRVDVEAPDEEDEDPERGGRDSGNGNA